MVRTDPTYMEPNGHPVLLTPTQCEEKNAQALHERQRAAQQAQADQQKLAAADAQIVRDEERRGYKHVTLKDLLLDARAYAANAAKVAVSGFYKLHGRRDERLYASYNDLMMHTYQSVEASYIGLLTDDGNRPLREYLMRCGATFGCEVTILGHVSPCVETNVFGATAGDFCLVAEAMRPQ